MNSVKGAFVLVASRFRVVFMWVWITAVACLIAGKGFPPLRETVLVLLTTFFFSVAVYLYNDIIDVELDKYNLNKNHRPLPSNLVSIEDARKTVFVFSLLGIISSINLNFISLPFIYLYFILFIIYSYPKIHLKTKFLIKELTITSGMLLNCLFANYAILDYISLKILFVSILFSIFSFAGQPALHDITDIEVDKKFGVKTLASILSWEKRVKMLLFAMLIIMTLTPLTYRQLGFNTIFPIFVILGGLIMLRYIHQISKEFEYFQVIKVRNIAFGFFLFLSVISIISSLDLIYFLNI